MQNKKILKNFDKISALKTDFCRLNVQDGLGGPIRSDAQLRIILQDTDPVPHPSLKYILYSTIFRSCILIVSHFLQILVLFFRMIC
jgi:hypothetical protein